MTKHLARRESGWPNRPKRVYGYQAEIVGDLPEWVIQHAEVMRQCWNDLAGELRRALRPFQEEEEQIREEFRAQYEAAEENQAEIERLREEERLRLQPVFRGKLEAVKPFKDTRFVREVTRRYKGVITSDLYEQAMIARWKGALGAWSERRRHAGTDGRPGRWEAGLPRIRHDLDSINLVYIYATNTGQEITFAQLYQEGGVGGLSLWRVPDESSGRNAEFVVKSSGRTRKLRPVQLSVKFNRLPPMSSFVKRVSLVRRKDELAVDRWGLQFLLQLPEPQPRVMTNRVAGYNSIGWRLLEDRIRIGVIADNAGHFYEISVPIMMADHHQRREREFVEALGREYRKGIDWFDLSEMDSAIGNRVQGCKDRLRELYRSEQDRWPGEASRLMAAIDRMREGGLQNLSTLLASSELESAGHLATSLAEIEALKRVRDRWSAKANRSKRDAYRQISVWIARNFDRVTWSPGSLRVMAEDVNQEYGIKLSQHRRQIVGQFQLRVYVEQAADKYQSDLQKSAESYVCPECGKKLRKDGKLLTACEGGHFMDLDVAASLYYLRRTPNVNHLCAEPCAIPDHLSRYLRLMSASETVIRRTVSR